MFFAKYFEIKVVKYGDSGGMVITEGAANRFLEDWSPDMPRECFFGNVLQSKFSSMVTLVILRCFPTARTILINVGASNRFLEDLSTDMPRECFFGKFCEIKVAKYDVVSHFKVFPDSQDHLG